MSEPNSLVGRVYFEGDGQMAVPPEYFLQRMYDYDALLVMFPSQRVPGAYVIARRRENSAGLTGGALADYLTQPDTKTCVAMGWIPVCLMYQTGISWDPSQIIAKLTARDIRAEGGADKVSDMLEEQEAAEVARTKAAIYDDQWTRSGDAWRSYQHRTGASSILGKDNFPSKSVEKRITLQRTAAADSTAATSRSTAGLDGDSTPVTIGGEG